MIAGIEKEFGKEAICGSYIDVERVPSGSLILDRALGGGYGLGRLVEIFGHESSGKALKNGTKIFTEQGLTPIESLRIGDKVYASDGNLYPVTGVYPQGIKRLYKVRFIDGVEKICSEDHIWFAKDMGNPHIRKYAPRTLKSMIEKGVLRNRVPSDYRRGITKPNYRWEIPLCKPLEREPIDCFISPYILGVLLGDGCLHCYPTMAIGNTDSDIIDRVKLELNDGYRITVCRNQKNCSQYRIVKDIYSRENEYISELDRLGIRVPSSDKFIPKNYLNGSISQRRDLLAGLMDTDGCVSASVVSYTSASLQLINDIIYLVQSLGGYTSPVKLCHNTKGFSYYSISLRVTFNPFSCKRKHSKAALLTGRGCHRKVVAIDEVDAGECTCISIDSPDHSYLLEDHVITHNTSLAIHACREVQDMGRSAGYIDTEQAMDPDYMRALGVDLSPEKFVLSQADSAEMALSIMRRMLDCPDIGLIILDSIAALVPKARIDGEVGDAVIALVARLMSAELPLIAQKAKKNKTLVIFINQYRSNIGFMGAANTTPGGNAMKFYASQRIEICRMGNKKEGDDVTAIRSKVTVKKNKIAPPFKQAEISIAFGKGIDIMQEILDLSIEQGIIKKNGSWFSYNGTSLGQGEVNVKTVLSDNPELLEEIRKQIKLD